MFTPSEVILERYAHLLVRFALNGGKGIRPNDVVQLTVPDTAKPLLPFLLRSVLDAGGHPKIHFVPTQIDKEFLTNATDEQLRFYPDEFKTAEAALIRHQVSIIADADPRELMSVDPRKIFRAMDSRKKFRDLLYKKEQAGTFSWTLALYGTPAMAAEASISIEQYWGQIVTACFLDHDDPITEWKSVQKEQTRIKKALDALEIEWLHVEAAHIDLHVQVGKNRRWLGGTCRNIPSFELFISPDWHGTKGKIAFSQPLYRYGNILRGVELEFSDGLVTRASATEGQTVLESMIARTHANRIGEYSLTDRRFSKITTFMANTLYDENVGGPFGNTHLALGRAYRDSYTGDPDKLSEHDWDALGFNDSPEHTDIISTEDRIVTATLPSGQKKVIFKDGMFTV